MDAFFKWLSFDPVFDLASNYLADVKQPLTPALDGDRLISL